MATLPFQGNGTPLTSAGISLVTNSLSINAPEIWTVLAVETSGCGYLADRRPQILYERHIFHRLTAGQYNDGDISDPEPGGYGPRGAPQYERLARAISKHRAAALQSTSWGLGQIMGMNFLSAGYSSVEEMVAAMSDSEDRQLQAMGSFLKDNKLAESLQTHNWASFARGYNGPNYAINQYDVRLSSQYQKYLSNGVPDLGVRSAQLYLTYLGFAPGPVDGIAGQRTINALSQFLAQNSLPPVATIDAQSVARLQSALIKATGAAA